MTDYNETITWTGGSHTIPRSVYRPDLTDEVAELGTFTINNPPAGFTYFFNSRGDLTLTFDQSLAPSGCTDTDLAFVVTFAEGLLPPVITSSAADISEEVGVAFYKQFTATDADAEPGDTLAFTAGGLPPGLSMDTSGDLTGTFQTSGTYPVTVTVTDADGLTDMQTFTFTIAQPDTGCVGTIGTYSGVAASSNALFQGPASEVIDGQILFGQHFAANEDSSINIGEPGGFDNRAAGEPVEIAADLGGVQCVESISLYWHYPDARVYDFDISVSTDGVNYTIDQAGLSSNDPGDGSAEVFPLSTSQDITHYMIRSRGNSTGNGWTTLYETEWTGVQLTVPPAADSMCYPLTSTGEPIDCAPSFDPVDTSNAVTVSTVGELTSAIQNTTAATILVDANLSGSTIDVTAQRSTMVEIAPANSSASIPGFNFNGARKITVRDFLSLPDPSRFVYNGTCQDITLYNLYWPNEVSSTRAIAHPTTAGMDRIHWYKLRAEYNRNSYDESMMHYGLNGVGGNGGNDACDGPAIIGFMRDCQIMGNIGHNWGDLFQTQTESCQEGGWTSVHGMECPNLVAACNTATADFSVGANGGNNSPENCLDFKAGGSVGAPAQVYGNIAVGFGRSSSDRGVGFVVHHTSHDIELWGNLAIGCNQGITVANSSYNPSSTGTAILMGNITVRDNLQYGNTNVAPWVNTGQYVQAGSGDRIGYGNASYGTADFIRNVSIYTDIGGISGGAALTYGQNGNTAWSDLVVQVPSVHGGVYATYTIPGAIAPENAKPFDEFIWHDGENC